MYSYEILTLLLIPAFILSLYAQIKVSSTFKKYSKIKNTKGLTGAQVTRQILDSEGLTDIRIELTNGKLSDHYSPKERIIRLSSDVYNSDSIAAIGVAAHECGHAIQEKYQYFPNTVRTAIVPIASIGSFAALPLFILGFLFSFYPLVTAGIILYSLVVLFYMILLPVEFNASNRAIAILGNNSYLSSDELKGSKKVLQAAAMTYVASALMALLQLLRLIAMSSRK